MIFFFINLWWCNFSIGHRWSTARWPWENLITPKGKNQVIKAKLAISWFNESLFFKARETCFLILIRWTYLFKKKINLKYTLWYNIKTTSSCSDFFLLILKFKHFCSEWGSGDLRDGFLDVVLLQGNVRNFGLNFFILFNHVSNKLAKISNSSKLYTSLHTFKCFLSTF